MGLSRSERLVLVLLSIAILGGRVVRNRIDRAGDLVVAADSAVSAADGARAAPVETAGGEVRRAGAGEDSAGAGVDTGRDAVRGDAGGASRPPGPIDINSATPEELVGLPGIGPAKAAAIVDRRRALGPYRKIADLLEVPGIGPKTLAQLEGLVIVGALAAPAGGAR